MSKYFKFKGDIYCSDTVVKIYDNKKEKFGFSTYLNFVEFIETENKYYFCNLHNCWKEYSMTEEELELCIESIATAYGPTLPGETNDESYDVDGIVPAWTWFILALVASLFVQGILNKILIQIVAISVFTIWRESKKKGE